MFALSVCFGPANTVWRFLFNEEPAARAAYSSLRFNAPQGSFDDVEIVDDYGQSARFHGYANGVMLEDLDKSKIAHVEHTCHEQRIRAAASTRLTNDPEIKAAMNAQMNAQRSGVMTPGPSVYSPIR